MAAREHNCIIDVLALLTGSQCSTSDMPGHSVFAFFGLKSQDLGFEFDEMLKLVMTCQSERFNAQIQ